MAGIVIYGSQFGSAKRYAEELARRTGLEALPFDAVADINKYEVIAYVGSLYAGGVMGMKKTFSKLASFEGKTVVIATVGLADPTDPENVANIEANMRRQLPAEVLASERVFHLRGAIDYSQLGFKHKTMMRLLYTKAKNLTEEEKNAEVCAMIETYGKQVDFTDFDSLDPLVAALQA
ncbi:MAG: hypothetical protein IJ781_02580 [Atopobiaceae bacterium]|nr:hypothetical protein [Atopobiaceae bacterium]